MNILQPGKMFCTSCYAASRSLSNLLLYSLSEGLERTFKHFVARHLRIFQRLLIFQHCTCDAWAAGCLLLVATGTRMPQSIAGSHVLTSWQTCLRHPGASDKKHPAAQALHASSLKICGCSATSHGTYSVPLLAMRSFSAHWPRWSMQLLPVK